MAHDPTRGYWGLYWPHRRVRQSYAKDFKALTRPAWELTRATICCLRSPKTTCSPREHACSSWILTSAVCKS